MAQLGQAVGVWWSGDGSLFPGRVVAVQPDRERPYEVLYDDGSRGWERGDDLCVAPGVVAQLRREKGPNPLGSRGRRKKWTRLVQGKSVVGQRVAVWWDGDAALFYGTVVDYDLSKPTKKYKVMYDDGYVEWEKRADLTTNPQDSDLEKRNPSVNLGPVSSQVEQKADSLKGDKNESLVGRRVHVWWDGDQTHFAGYIIAEDCSRADGKHYKVLYDDDFEDWEKLDGMILVPQPETQVKSSGSLTRNERLKNNSKPSPELSQKYLLKKLYSSHKKSGSFQSLQLASAPGQYVDNGTEGQPSSPGAKEKNGKQTSSPSPRGPASKHVLAASTYKDESSIYALAPAPKRAKRENKEPKKDGENQSAGKRKVYRRKIISTKDLVDAGYMSVGDQVCVRYKFNEQNYVFKGSVAKSGAIYFENEQFLYPTAFSLYCKRKVNPSKVADVGWLSVFHIKADATLVRLETYRVDFLADDTGTL